MLYSVPLVDGPRARRATRFVVFGAGHFAYAALATARGNRSNAHAMRRRVAITPARTSPPRGPNETVIECGNRACITTWRLSVCRARFKSRSCHEVTHAGSSSRRRVHRRPCAASFGANDPLRYASPATREPRRRANLIVDRDLSRLSEATIAKPPRAKQNHWRVAHNCALAPGGSLDGGP